MPPIARPPKRLFALPSRRTGVRLFSPLDLPCCRSRWRPGRKRRRPTCSDYLHRVSCLGEVMSGTSNIPLPHNEPVLSYAPGSPERAALKSALTSVGSRLADIPAVVGGREVRNRGTPDVVSPPCYGRVLARAPQADRGAIGAGVNSPLDARRRWGAPGF